MDENPGFLKRVGISVGTLLDLFRGDIVLIFSWIVTDLVFWGIVQFLVIKIDFLLSSLIFFILSVAFVHIQIFVLKNANYGRTAGGR